MGEHATYRGAEVKIGTCENMYYLRAEQRHAISGYTFELDVDRFRFPFPDEDACEPGSFADHDRGVRIPGYSLPAELSGDEHGSVQFVNREAGYVLSIPCPEGRRLEGDSMSTDVDGLRVGRNGFSGYPVVRQQAFRGGHLVTLVSCGACGCLHRLDTLEDAEPVIQAFRDEAERTEWRRVSSEWDQEAGHWGTGPATFGDERVHAAGSSSERFHLEMAARIMAGYFVRDRVPA